MNGGRRCVLGTVLSIQNKHFTYPACQSCLSRLALSSNRFRCQKCGRTCEDAAHRYRLCVKIAEGQTLYIITVFGSCLEKIFGTGASSLHRILQASEPLPCGAEGERAQELLFQAAEDCLIGRSFLFATKVADTLHNDTSALQSRLVASQLIPVNNEPTWTTILNRYYCLTESVSSKSSFLSKADLSHGAPWDLSESQSSTSFHPGGDQFPGYWQQSLGLISSPTDKTSAQATPPSPCHNRPKEDKAQSQFLENEIFIQEPKETIDIFAPVDPSNFPINSPLTINESLISTRKYGANTHDSQPCSSHFHGQSAMPCWQHGYLQNVCNSGSYWSQSRSAGLKRFPSPNIQTAESHQAEVGTWEEFPFSESLSEFIVRLENAEETRFHSRIKQTKLRLSNEKERLSRNTSEFIKTPEALLATNKTLLETSTQNYLRGGGDPNTHSEEPFQQGSTSRDLQRSARDFMSVDSCASVDNTRNSQCGISLHKKEREHYVIAEDLKINVATNSKQDNFSPPKEARDLNSELTRQGDQNGSTSEAWDEFPFTESLSEFIGRLEKAGEGGFHSNFKEAKFCLCSRKKKPCGMASKSMSKFIKTPEAFLALPSQKAKNKTRAEITTRNGFGGGCESNSSVNDACKISQSDIRSSSSEESGGDFSLGNLGGPLEKSFRSVNSFASESIEARIPFINAENYEFKVCNFVHHVTKNMKDPVGSSSHTFKVKDYEIIMEEDQQHQFFSESLSKFKTRVENGEETKDPSFNFVHHVTKNMKDSVGSSSHSFEAKDYEIMMEDDLHQFFSESLSKFKTRVEKGDETKDTSFSLRNKNEEACRSLSKTTSDYVKTPEAFLAWSCQKVKNETLTKAIVQDSSGGMGDSELNTVLENPCEISRPCLSSKEPVDCSPSRNLWGCSEKILVSDIAFIDFLANVSTIQNPTDSSQRKTSLLKYKNVPYVETYEKGNSQTPHSIPNVSMKNTWCIFPLGQGIASRLKEPGYVDKERMLENYHRHRPRSDGPTSTSDCENYNASDDLFDPFGSMEELSNETQPKCRKALKRRYGAEIKGFKSALLEDSPCLDVIVYHRRSHTHSSYLQDDLKTYVDEQILEEYQQPEFRRSLKSHGMEDVRATVWDFSCVDAIVPHRRSNIHVSHLQKNHETAAIHIQNLLPYLQSTPVGRQRTKSSFRASFNGQGSPVSSISMRSRKSLTKFLMRKMRRSLGGSNSTFLEKFPDCSPISTSFLGVEFSRDEVLPQKKTPVRKLATRNKMVQNKVSCDIRTHSSESSDDGIGYVTRDGTDQSEEKTICDGANVSPVTPLSQDSLLKLLPGEWSPELFQEKSNIVEQVDSVQKRLF